MSVRSNGPVPDGGSPHNVDCDYVHDLAEGYALGAIEPSERERVAAHLVTCPECRALIEELRRTVALLPFLSFLSQPSAEAKMALMARIEQSRPVTAPAAVGMSRPSAPAARQQPREPVPTGRFHPALFALPLAAVLLLAVVWSFSLQHRLNEAEDQLDVVQQTGVVSLLNAPAEQAEMYAFKRMCAGCASGGRLKAASHGKTAVLVAWSLDPEAVHEVWILGVNDTWHKIATLQVSKSGDAMQLLYLSQPLSAYQAVMVSMVPAGDGDMRSTPELMVEPVAILAPGGISTLEN